MLRLPSRPASRSRSEKVWKENGRAFFAKRARCVVTGFGGGWGAESGRSAGERTTALSRLRFREFAGAYQSKREGKVAFRFSRRYDARSTAHNAHQRTRARAGAARTGTTTAR